jgi:hypothetical protein
MTDEAHENSHSDSNCEGDESAMLDLMGEAAQGIVTKLRYDVPDLRCFVGHGIGSATKPRCHAGQR